MQAGSLAAYAYPFKKQILISADRTLTTQDLQGVLLVDTSEGPVTLTLPAANTVRGGGYFNILALTGSVFPVTVVVKGGDTYNEGAVAPVVLSQDAQGLLILGTEAATKWLAVFDFAALGGGQHNVGYVDLVKGNDATGAIGTLRPFKTIQAFLNAVPAGNDSTSARNVFTAEISPGDYDEDLSVDISRKRIVLTGPGSWNLGTFNAADWGPSGTRRNITVTASAANIDGIRPGLVITNNLPLTEAMTTHESYLTKPRISGKLDLTGAVGPGSIELGLTCEIFGDAGVSIDAGLAVIQSYIYHSRMRGTVTGSNWQFQVAERTRFSGLITVDNYSLIQSCRIDGGMTVTSVPPAGITPFGIVDTIFTGGTFTGPALSVLLDGYSNFYFKANGVALAGGATKVITEDLAP
jgi:hypothetical protein